MRAGVRAVAALALAGTALTACSGGGPAPTPTPGPTAAPGLTSASSAPPTHPTRSPMPSPTPDDHGATPAPAWLGTRVLPIGPHGYGVASGTPPELVHRRIVTTDVLPPPSGGGFAATVTPVPDSVVRRSTWSPRCPVTLARLRYVTVSFRGFDGRAHTGELLVDAGSADGVVAVFRRLYAVGFPIERMVITTVAERDAPPTGDGNTTAAFVCRPARGSTTWSEHAYGRAIDVNPFQNPYVRGRTVLPELARAYTDRRRVLPGVITADGPVVDAFRSIGWTWGGSWSSPKDHMHFSSTGR